jgi:hypothetical protein
MSTLGLEVLVPQQQILMVLYQISNYIIEVYLLRRQNKITKQQSGDLSNGS